MPLRKARGDMYPFITHTWNPIKGKCPHGCSYCYVDRIARRFGKEQTAPYLDVKELHCSLGSGNYIFVGSSIDMFAEDIKDVDTFDVLNMMTNENWYLLQSKNPARALEFDLRGKIVFATTAETNRQYPVVMENAPPVEERIAALNLMSRNIVMVTVEPIMDFDTKQFADTLLSTVACQFNIGADSGRNGLPEPDAGKVRELIAALGGSTKIVLKKNLRRILPEHPLYKE